VREEKEETETQKTEVKAEEVLAATKGKEIEVLHSVQRKKELLKTKTKDLKS
jgi:hypothetical protein